VNKTLIERRSLIKMGAFALAGSALPLASCASQTGSASSPPARCCRECWSKRIE
jgi:hypothetical protein